MVMPVDFLEILGRHPEEPGRFPDRYPTLHLFPTTTHTELSSSFGRLVSRHDCPGMDTVEAALASDQETARIILAAGQIAT